MKKNYYVNGSTVRELHPQPERKPRQNQEELKKIQKRKQRKNAARRNRERAMSMSRGYVAFLTVCVLLSAFSAFSLIQIQSQITQRMKRIAALESQVTDLRADNDARHNEIMTSVDLNYIKDVAINELGMSYAAEDQIIYYTVENNNFMDQYSDIPE
uniref:hypothetical protein n=1 Tax=Agathobacter sp. TaxID=2021311 RepID=UPI0040565BB7